MKQPIWSAYQGAVDAPCPHCGAEPGIWCTNSSNGRVRRVPCIERTTGLAIVAVEREDRYRDFSEPIHPSQPD